MTLTYLFYTAQYKKIQTGVSRFDDKNILSWLQVKMEGVPLL